MAPGSIKLTSKEVSEAPFGTRVPASLMAASQGTLAPIDPELARRAGERTFRHSLTIYVASPALRDGVLREIELRSAPVFTSSPSATLRPLSP